MTGATSRAPSGLRVYYLLFDLKREGARYFTARNSTGILLSFKFSSARPSTTFPGRQRGCTLFLLKCITTKPDEKGNRTEVPRIRRSVFRIFIRPHLKSNTCKHVTIYTLDFCGPDCRAHTARLNCSLQLCYTVIYFTRKRSQP